MMDPKIAWAIGTKAVAEPERLDLELVGDRATGTSRRLGRAGVRCLEASRRVLMVLIYHLVTSHNGTTTP
jgi:hypothetical protein